jgi:septal ring factor EnvC (AmiA/AmiB activator)
MDEKVKAEEKYDAVNKKTQAEIVGCYLHFSCATDQLLTVCVQPQEKYETKHESLQKELRSLEFSIKQKQELISQLTANTQSVSAYNTKLEQRTRTLEVERESLRKELDHMSELLQQTHTQSTEEMEAEKRRRQSLESQLERAEVSEDYRHLYLN